MLSFATRSRSSDAPVRRGPQPQKNPSHDEINNPNPTSPAHVGLAGDSVPAINLSIANYSARDITLVIGLDFVRFGQ